MDNAEHVLGGPRAMIDAVHTAAPGVRLLVTSQAPLKLAGERVYLLRGLEVPAQLCSAAEALRHGAVALFDARARAASTRFRLRRPQCGQCDRGLPFPRRFGAWCAACCRAARVLPLPVVAETLARHDIGPNPARSTRV